MGRPVADGLFVVEEGEPVLVGSRCRSCAAVRFPSAGECSRCGSAATDAVPLSRRGILWSFTAQGFPPKSPPFAAPSFEPYGVGYVDLGEVIVEARLTESDPEKLRIGMEMELTLLPFMADVDTFAFRPV